MKQKLKAFNCVDRGANNEAEHGLRQIDTVYCSFMFQLMIYYKIITQKAKHSRGLISKHILMQLSH